MRIALVIERMEAWRGGAETSTQQFAHALVHAGREVHLVTASRGQPTGGIHLHMITDRAFGRALRTADFVSKARQFVLAERFDVVHAVAPFPGCNLYQPRGGTVIETAERNLMLQPPGKRPLKRLLNRFNIRQQVLRSMERRMLTGQPPPRVVALSDYVVRQLRTQYNVPEANIRKVFNAVDVAPLVGGDHAADRALIRQTYHIAQDDVLLLCVAHNFRLKGVAQLIQALIRMHERTKSAGRTLPGYKLVVIGRDDPVPHLTAAEAAGIADHVHFPGSTDRMPAFFHAADVLVHPTFYDPCSRVVLEALAAGVPCITTRDNGAHEVMQNDRHGVVISSAEAIDELSAAIEGLLERPTRQVMAENCRELVDAVSMQRHVREMLAVYDQIAATGPRVEEVCRGLGVKLMSHIPASPAPARPDEPRP